MAKGKRLRPEPTGAGEEEVFEIVTTQEVTCMLERLRLTGMFGTTLEDVAEELIRAQLRAIALQSPELARPNSGNGG